MIRIRMALPPVVVVVCAALAWMAAANDAQAADISTDRSPACDIRLTGEIDTGDADTLLAAIQAVDQSTAPEPRLRLEYENEQDMFVPRVCLDSKGGRFDEAMKFIRATIKQVSFVTVIESGAECYSACALIFLGGHFNQGDGYYELYRRLHVDGRLGFHAPYIQADGGAGDKLLSASYRAGVNAVGQLLDLEGDFFPRSLMAEFLKIGSDEFFRIERVGQLAAWNIVLTGYERPTAVHSKRMENVCDNQRLRDQPDYYYTPIMIRNIDVPDRGEGMRLTVANRVVRHNEVAIEGVAGCSVIMRMHDGILFMRADTRGSTAGDPDPKPWPRDSLISNKAAANVHGMDADGYTPAFYLYPPNAKIAELTRAN